MNRQEILENLVRLRVATVTGYLPPDLGYWALATLNEAVPKQLRESERVRLIRAAAAATGGSRKSAAQEIRRIALELRAAWGYYGRRRPNEGTVHGLVHQAMAIDPEMPVSVRQLMRLLEGGGVTEAVACHRGGDAMLNP